MRRRDFTSLLAAAPAALGDEQAAQLPEQTVEKRKPNIVLITADHLRWNHLGVNGNPYIHTPRMDALAKGGARFTMLQTVGVACAPNRASLFTGRYPHSHGLMENGVKMPESEVTLTRVLRENGYYAGQMGKLHFWPHSRRNHREPFPPYDFNQLRLADEPGCYDDAFGLWLDAQGPEVRRKARVAMPADRGKFDHYVFAGDEKTTFSHWVAGETVRFINEVKDRPFFVHAGFYAPHPPLNPPAAMLELYKNAELPPRIYRDDEAQFAPPSLKKPLTALRGTPESLWTDYRRYFYAMVSELDRNVGRILDTLDSAGIRNNTIVVLTSDHGDYLGDHNLTGKSDFPYDGAMRVPLVFRGPGIPEGAVCEKLCEHVDTMPTLLDLLGIPNTKGNQGVSLKSAISGGATKDVTFMEGRHNRIVRTPSALYAYWRNGDECLFDLTKDPNQLRNIAEERGAKTLLDHMRRLMLGRTLEIVDPLPERIAPY